MQISAPLILTKVRVPSIRPRLVPRPRLQEQILRGLQSPLTVVITPAGFGKTTLVASCVATRQIQAAWLSLDKNDNDAERFLTYLLAALHESDNSIGEAASELMQRLQQPHPEAVLTSLINDLDNASREIVLVLDDYQFISNQAVHDAVIFLLEHCAPTFHLVIATRADPPLPLARMRARGQLVELRVNDLTFTEAEATYFLNDVMGLHLDAGSVAILEERTEGWIAGLQMAALSMRDRKDISGFIGVFSGTNRYILDYLLEEVLANQPLEIQYFLLNTSILERLTAPLCDAVILPNADPMDNEGAPGSGMFYHESSSILDYLERASLFLLPLDDERIWYRYHGLFADLLRARLLQSQSGRLHELHQRAAAWLVRNGLVEDAMDHALAAEDFDMAAEILEENRVILEGQVGLSTYLAWVQAFPREQLYRHPVLCLRYAFVLALAGYIENVGELIQTAEQYLQRHPEPNPARARDQAALFGYVSAYYSSFQGDLDKAIEHSTRALNQAREEDSVTRSTIMTQLGEFYATKSELDLASRWLRQAIMLHLQLGQVRTVTSSYRSLVEIAQVQGRLHLAEDLCRESLRLIEEQGERPLGIAGLSNAGLADILRERNELASALELAQKGVEQTRVLGQPYQQAITYCILARVLLAAGDLQGLQQLLIETEALAQRYSAMPQVKATLDLTNVRIWLVRGDLPAAVRWADEQGLRIGAQLDYHHEEQYLILSRILLDQGHFDEALELLARLQTAMDAGERRGRLIEALILQAKGLSKQKKIAQALAPLEKALELGESEGYVRVFLDEGKSMQLLLAQWLINASTSPVRDYAIQLLAQFDKKLDRCMAAREKAQLVNDTSADSGQALVEPLSRRELEVLHLLALGKTNHEIAQQLVVASGTVKAQAASIYRKLDVHNRTEAVARARQVGILL